MKAGLSHPIATTWAAGGPFIGADKYASRVTVELGWELRSSTGPVGSFTKLPVRWFQRADGSEVETEIPNVMKVSIRESIDTDAAICTIVMLNQKMDTAAPASGDIELGSPGYFTPTRGSDATATARWGHSANEWANVLTPNALIRVYQGMGGHSKTLAQALADGDIVKTFTGLIDEDAIVTEGTITLTCRSMAKLAIDQPVAPPLVPETDTSGCAVWPLDYCYERHVAGTQTEVIPYGAFLNTGRYIRGMEYAPDVDPCSLGEGYWLVGDDGGVFTYGHNEFYGSMAGVPLTLPVVGIARSATARGYWLVAADGGVFAFGDAGFYGSVPGDLVTVSDIIGIETSPGGAGYYIVSGAGVVRAYGDAPAVTGPVFGGTCVGMAVAPGGYWLVNSAGQVYAYGTLIDHGDVPGGPYTDIVSITATPTGAGYYVVRANGAVYAFGDAVYQGGAEGIALNDPICDIVAHPNGTGYWLAAEDGGVFTYGTSVSYYGSLPGPWVNLGVIPGNVPDYVTVVTELLLWAGWWLNDNGVAAGVFGNLESTGIHPPGCLGPDFLANKTVMDVITAIKQLVGFITFVDHEGAFNFTSPNFWKPGNYLPDGTHTTEIPVADEQLQMTAYGVALTDRPLRSEIVIANAKPSAGVEGTVVTRYTPVGSRALRNIVKPMHWFNEVFTDAAEQQTMAELIDLHIWFQQRLGSLTIAANHLLQVNDQLRIYERVTEETFVHYIRSIDSDHDLETGVATMTLTTNWLGDPAQWAATWPTFRWLIGISDTVGLTDAASTSP